MSARLCKLLSVSVNWGRGSVSGGVENWVGGVKMWQPARGSSLVPPTPARGAGFGPAGSFAARQPRGCFFCGAFLWVF